MRARCSRICSTRRLTATPASIAWRRPASTSDAITARQQELNYGIETSSDGVYAEPELPDDSPARTLFQASLHLDPAAPGRLRRFRRRCASHRLGARDYAPARVGGTESSLSFLKKELARISGEARSGAIAQAKPSKEKERPHTSSNRPATHVTNPEQGSRSTVEENPRRSRCPPTLSTFKCPVRTARRRADLVRWPFR